MDEQLQLEKKAAEVHEIWAHWMDHFFKKFCDSMGSGCAVFTVPMPIYMRWLDQIKTAYNDLTEKEKESDRDIARRLLENI